MTIPQQLLTAFLILVSLPLVLKILWKIRLLPFALGLSLPYLMGRQWTAEHKAVYLVLLIGGALFALAIWTYRIVDAVRTERWYRIGSAFWNGQRRYIAKKRGTVDRPSLFCRHSLKGIYRFVLHFPIHPSRSRTDGQTAPHAAHRP